MFGRGLRTLSIASLVLVLGAFSLVFFYAPNDADQGFVQKIFYLHVPLAIVALGGFVTGGIYAVRYLMTGDRAHDLRSYVAIHLSLILGIGVLATGSIWAKASWGAWWVWDEPTLVSFLIVFLLYATYQPMRFSIEDREKQARWGAVAQEIRTVGVASAQWAPGSRSSHSRRASAWSGTRSSSHAVSRRATGSRTS